MKIGIIAANNIRYSPYIFFYTDILARNGIEFELIYPDRNGIDESFDGIAHCLPWNKKLPTLLNYALYAKAVTKVVRKRKYDALIILTSVNAAYLALWLKHNYSARYIVDIRDYSHENIPPYYYLESVAVRNSVMNVISSAKFTEFLPHADYSVCHNIGNDVAHHSDYSFCKAEGVIRIGYVGSLSYIDQCNRLMKLVAKDERFALDYYGSSNAEPTLKEYAKQLSCERIQFHGAYSAHEKATIIQNVNILFNAYGNGIPLLDCALSNKLYDSLIHKKPILTCPSTYMTEMGGPLAFPIKLVEERTLDRLYDWYTGIDSHEVEVYAERTLMEVVQEHEATKRMIATKLLVLKEKRIKEMKD